MARRGRIDWARVPSRVVLLVAFAVGAAAFVLASLPFSAAGEGDQVLRCGPPLFEVVVPADPAFDVAENAGCSGPAKARIALAVAGVVLAVIGAAVVEARARRGTLEHHASWLEARRSRSRRPPERV